jgi:hypothetical protein
MQAASDRSAEQETTGYLVKSHLAVEPVGDHFQRQPPPVRHGVINTVSRPRGGHR